LGLFVPSESFLRFIVMIKTACRWVEAKDRPWPIHPPYRRDQAEHLRRLTVEIGHLRDHWDETTERFDTIIIDEAQDFSPNWIELLIRLLEPDGPRRLLMLTDEFKRYRQRAPQTEFFSSLLVVHVHRQRVHTDRVGDRVPVAVHHRPARSSSAGLRRARRLR
jgi:hypothetical protein